MLKSLFSVILFAPIIMAASFSSGNQMAVSPCGGNELTVTKPSPGSLLMEWHFENGGSSYSYSIEDLSRHTIVRSGTTAQTSYSASNLETAVTYRCMVSNGYDFVIIDMPPS